MEISEETKARLEKIGSVGASYDAVINECIDKLEQIEVLENRSCQNCKNVLYCKFADDVKTRFGLKLKEQCFYCWESI